MRILIVLLSFIVASCSVPNLSNNTGPSVIIDAETGTDQDLDCDRSSSYTRAAAAVSSKLMHSWDQIVGEKNTSECVVRLNVNAEGDVLGHELVRCAQPEHVAQVLAQASPLPVGLNQCMGRRINKLKFVLNQNALFNPSVQLTSEAPMGENTSLVYSNRSIGDQRQYHYQENNGLERQESDGVTGPSNNDPRNYYYQ